MGLSEGTVQSEATAANGDISFDAGARYHPFVVKSLLWGRDNEDPITLDVFVMSGNRRYPLNGFPKVAFVGKAVVLPDSSNPLGITLVPAQRICVKTTGQPGNRLQTAEVQWAEIAVP